MLTQQQKHNKRQYQTNWSTALDMDFQEIYHSVSVVFRRKVYSMKPFDF